MLKLEDYHSGQTACVDPFDVEALVENHLRSIPKETDVRGYKYEDTVLRPRHIIALNDVLAKYTDKIHLMTAPVVQFNGQTFEAKSRNAGAFVDLLAMLEDLCQTHSEVFLYQVFRSVVIDPNTFETKSAFVIRGAF